MLGPAKPFLMVMSDVMICSNITEKKTWKKNPSDTQHFPIFFAMFDAKSQPFSPVGRSNLFDASQTAEEKIREINDAYETLSNPPGRPGVFRSEGFMIPSGKLT